MNVSVKLRADGDVRIDLQQVELFFVAFFMDCAEQRAAGLYS